MQGGPTWSSEFADSLVELHGICEGADIVSSILLSGSPAWPQHVARPASYQRLSLEPGSDVGGSLDDLAVEVVRKLAVETSAGLGRCADIFCGWPGGVRQSFFLQRSAESQRC